MFFISNYKGRGTGIRPHNFTSLRFRFCKLVKPEPPGIAVKKKLPKMSRPNSSFPFLFFLKIFFYF